MSDNNHESGRMLLAAAALFCAGTVGLLSVISIDSAIPWLASAGSDTVDALHIPAYAALMLLTALALGPAPSRYALAAALVVGYGGLLELAQHLLVPWRTGSPADLLRDAAGVGAAALLVALGRAAAGLLRRRRGYEQHPSRGP